MCYTVENKPARVGETTGPMVNPAVRVGSGNFTAPDRRRKMRGGFFMGLSKKRIAELEAEAREFILSPEGKALRTKLNDAPMNAVELPLDANEDNWWVKAAEYLSPVEFNEFIETFELGSIKSIVYLRTKIRLAKRARNRPDRTWTEEAKAEARDNYNKVVALIEQGQTVERASQLAGISKATYYNYKDRFS